MFRTTRSLMTCAALALGLTAASIMIVEPADAAMKHRRHYKKMSRLRPATLKPGYMGAPGFAGGPAPYAGPPSAANPGLLGQGGFLGTGTIPQTQVFSGVPVLGQLGL